MLIHPRGPSLYLFLIVGRAREGEKERGEKAVDDLRRLIGDALVVRVGTPSRRNRVKRLEEASFLSGIQGVEVSTLWRM